MYETLVLPLYNRSMNLFVVIFAWVRIYLLLLPQYCTCTTIETFNMELLMTETVFLDNSKFGTHTIKVVGQPTLIYVAKVQCKITDLECLVGVLG